MDLHIVSYQDAHGQSGKLKGRLTLSDGRTYAVWDDELHAQCLELNREKVTPVAITSSKSERWGYSLRSITRQAAYVDAYASAMEADLARPPAHKRGGYTSRMIRQAVGKHVVEKGA